MACWGEHEQAALGESSVLVVGAGALGCPVLAYLAGAGVGRLGLVDDGVVELSNIHRQTLHYTPDVGVAKVDSAAAKLAFLNPDVLVETYPARLSADNGEALAAGHDLVVDCTDCWTSRVAVNDACCAAGVPALVEGGAREFHGMVLSIRPGESACYRCCFPKAPPADADDGPRGVLGPVPGAVGSLMAMEALKLLTGVGKPLLNRMLLLDLAAGSQFEVATSRVAGCAGCDPGRREPTATV